MGENSEVSDGVGEGDGKVDEECCIKVRVYSSRIRQLRNREALEIHSCCRDIGISCSKYAEQWKRFWRYRGTFMKDVVRVFDCLVK